MRNGLARFRSSKTRFHTSAVAHYIAIALLACYFAFVLFSHFRWDCVPVEGVKPPKQKGPGRSLPGQLPEDAMDSDGDFPEELRGKSGGELRGDSNEDSYGESEVASNADSKWDPKKMGRGKKGKQARGRNACPAGEDQIGNQQDSFRKFVAYLKNFRQCSFKCSKQYMSALFAAASIFLLFFFLSVARFLFWVPTINYYRASS